MLKDIRFIKITTCTLMIISIAQGLDMLPFLADGRVDFLVELPIWAKIWSASAFLIGLILPSIALLVWGDNPHISIVLRRYILIFMAQVISEVIFVSLFFFYIAAFVGLFYVTYRIFQLWHLGQHLNKQEPYTYHGVHRLLQASHLFWCVHGMLLISYAFPRVFGLVA